MNRLMNFQKADTCVTSNQIKKQDVSSPPKALQSSLPVTATDPHPTTKDNHFEHSLLICFHDLYKQRVIYTL